MKRIMFAVCTILGGLLLGGGLAEFAVRISGACADGPVVEYVVERHSSLFSPRLDPSDPLFYTFDGLRAKSDRLAIAYPDHRFRDFTWAPAPGTYRIAAVGDSLTEQWGLPGYANYTNFLEDLLKERVGTGRAEVLPLGVGGYTTWQERHLFERYLHRLEANLLLLQYCPNDGDVMRLRPRPPGAAVPAKAWPAYEIVGERFGRPDYARSAIGPLHSRLLWLLRYGRSSAPALRNHHQVAGNDEQRRALIWFRDLARARKIPLLVVIFPIFDDTYPQAEVAYIKALLGSLDIEYLSLLPALRSRGPLASVARDLYHPTVEGYRIAARAIFDHLAPYGHVAGFPDPATE